MDIRRIESGKRDFLPLLLLGDEQEDMIDRYLERGTMYVLEDGEVKAECVVADEGDGVLELKNIAVSRAFRAKAMERPSWTSSSEPIQDAMRCCRWALETARPPFRFTRSAGFAGTIW